MKDLSKEALLPHYDLFYFEPSFRNLVAFKASRYFSDYFKPYPWNKITNQLYLGKIPATNEHEKLIQFIDEEEGGQHPLKMVVSVVNYHEFGDSTVGSPLYWKEKGIEHHILPMTDGTAEVSDENVIALIQAIRGCILKGGSVLIHCKAGMSRSAMLTAIYMGCYGDGQKEINAIVSELKEKRPIIDLSTEKEKGKRLKAEQIIQEMRSNSLLDVNINENTTLRYIFDEKLDRETQLNQLLGSLRLKNDLLYFSSLWELILYASQKLGWCLSCQRRIHIRNFLMDIYAAKDGQWYLDLLSKDGPMQKLIDAEPLIPYSTPAFSLWASNLTQAQAEDQLERETIRRHFIKELNAYLAKTLGCSLGDIEDAIEHLLIPNHTKQNHQSAMFG